MRPGRASIDLSAVWKSVQERRRRTDDISLDQGRAGVCYHAQDWFNIISFEGKVEWNPDKLLFFVVDLAALVADKLEESEIAEAVFKFMQQFPGNPNITQISRVIRHTWLTDPFSLETWSSPSINSTARDYCELSGPLPSMAVPRLLLAGEHKHEKYWSYMHGAILSGIEQATPVSQVH